MKFTLYCMMAALVLCACNSSSNPVPPNPVPPANNQNGWDILTIPPGNVDLMFVNKAKGFLFGYNGLGLGKTLDSGKTWTSVSLPTPIRFVNISALNNQYVYAAALRNFVYTKDGGDSWIVKAHNFDARDVSFVTPSTGLLTTSTGLYHTTDTGNTWQRRMPGNWMGVHFVNSSTAWATSQDSGVYKTTDGGLTWTNLKRVTTPSHSIYFIDANRGWFTNVNTNNGFLVWRTTDGGATWNASALVNGFGYNDIKFVSPTTGYVGGGGTLYKSTDGGATWKAELTNPSQEFIDLFFLDSNNVWALTQGIQLFRWRK
jgi:photosystem II stability/assembly factor-like uncharacterized protein